MMKKILAVLILAFSVNAEECKPNLSVSKVESIAFHTLVLYIL